MVKLTSHTTVRIWLSHEQVQSLYVMNDHDAHNWIEEWYGIDAERILGAEIKPAPKGISKNKDKIDYNSTNIITIKIKHK